MDNKLENKLNFYNQLHTHKRNTLRHLKKVHVAFLVFLHKLYLKLVRSWGGIN